MKFLADMGLARSTVAFLRAQGHDAVHLRDQGLQRLEDEEIIEKARAEGRVILTHDLDFGRIIAVRRLPSHPRDQRRGGAGEEHPPRAH
jgi:predicted nuclease of predicted toxin-antitoxin system